MTENDVKDITKTIYNYFQGTYHADADRIREAFASNVRISGLINDELYEWTLDEFIQRLTREPSALQKEEKFDKEIISIDQTKHLAMVKARVAVGEMIFNDYIILVKMDGSWKIRSKFFTN